MNLNNLNNLSGEFYAQVKSYKSGTVRRTYGTSPNPDLDKSRLSRRSESIIERPIRNLITDTGLDYLGANAWNSSIFLHLGSGTEDFLPSDTLLRDPYTPTSAPTVETEANSYSSIDPTLSRFRTTNTTIYSVGKALGTFTELGASTGSNFNNPAASNYFLTRAMLALTLIRDDEGNPSEIEILPDEELILKHSVDNYVSQSTKASQLIDWKGEQVSCITRTRSISSSSWYISNNPGLGPVNINLRLSTGASGPALNGRKKAYVPGSYENYTYGNLGLTGSDENIYGFILTGQGDYEVVFDDGLPRVKLADEMLNFGTSIEPAFRTTWGRV